MYPHFLVIGAQKAGTTWLDRNLRTHPQIWLPPEKEIHFFDLPRPLPFAALQYAPQRSVRHWTRHRLQRDLAKVERGEQSRQWYQSYYYAIRSWRWYRSLFTPANGQSSGEITPRYAVIPPRIIASIRRRMPDLKIIYLLRDPIDRMWSDLAMFHDQRFGGRGTQTVNQSSSSTFLTRRSSLRHSRYEENIRCWEKFFPQEQILVGFMEDLANRPSDLLCQIFRFLGVDDTHQPPDALVKLKINFADYPTIPEDTARRLASFLIDDARLLNKRFASSYTEKWTRRIEKLVPDTATTPLVHGSE
jgi:hypothetical protein